MWLDYEGARLGLWGLPKCQGGEAGERHGSLRLEMQACLPPFTCVYIWYILERGGQDRWHQGKGNCSAAFPLVLELLSFSFDHKVHSVAAAGPFSPTRAVLVSLWAQGEAAFLRPWPVVSFAAQLTSRCFVSGRMGPFPEMFNWRTMPEIASGTYSIQSM